MRVLSAGLLALLVMFSHEQATAADLESFQAEPGKALVVFTRVSGSAGLIRTSIFDVTEERKIIGILKPKRYATYQVEPGDRMFMIVGESADFMRARLEAGKVYFANAQVRTGVWKARFSLIPWSAEDMQGKKFQKGIKRAKPQEDRDLELWAQQNANSLQKKQDRFFAKWQTKSEADKEERTLKDGR